MGRGLFSGRSTPALPSQPNISTPTLVSTDAQPRDDLHDLGEESSFIGLGRMRSKSRKEPERPKTAGGSERSRSASRARSNSRADARAARPPPPPIDQDLSPFPIAGPTPTYLNKEPSDGMIGMALGSPRGDPNWDSRTQPAEMPSLPMTSILNNSEERGSKPKNVKWKKLGGLFGGGKRQHDSRGTDHPRSFWDAYAQHAQVHNPTQDRRPTPQPEEPSEPSREELVHHNRPANPPPYSFTAPPRGESLAVPEPQVRSTPSPIEEVEQEINKMMPHNSWNVDDSPAISPVDEVDEIPLPEPSSPRIATIEQEPPPEANKRQSMSSPTVPPMHPDSDSESVLLQLEQPPPPESTSFLDTGFDFSQAPLLDIPLDFGSGPLLNIDIPSVQMDRFSVMFGSLLKTDTGNSSITKTDTDRSSILARRQIDKHLERLKTIPDSEEEVEEEPPKEEKSEEQAKADEMDREELIAKVSRKMSGKKINEPLTIQVPNPEPSSSTTPSSAPDRGRDDGKLLEVKPQRRATSPSPIRSPSFSLFPSASPKATKIHGSYYTPSKPSGLQRSHTAPGAISPNRPTFDSPSQTRNVGPALDRILFRVQSPAQTTSSSSSNPHKWSSDGSLMSPVSSVSSEDDEGEELILHQKPLMPLVEQEEPAWEMVDSANANEIAKPSGKEPSQPGEGTTHPDSSKIPTVSIARQVSITKRRHQQSQQKIQQKSHIPIRKDTTKAPLERDRLEVDERLIDRQPHTPTLVEPSHGYGGAHGHRAKKSENVVIESI